MDHSSQNGSSTYTSVYSLSESDDAFKILLASDIHLGVHEKDGIRGNDSFTTFEEILKLANEKDVDFILLGGDLFHENVPTPQCLHKCLALLRKYCMGDKPIAVNFESDSAINFKHCVHPIVNYEDPNLNIAYPIFSIHGNHDDPTGFGRMSALDILSVSGLLNYFGKWTDLNKITMTPLIMSKGHTKIAIYGLSNIKDERLYRLFGSKLVEFDRTGTEGCFNILVLHQNRVERGPTNFVPERMIPDFFDFVFWGHEHECRVKPEENISKGFVVLQPGSPVATSLCEGEAAPKHVFVLSLDGKNFSITPVPLKTVRPFVIHTQRLSEWKIRASDNMTEMVQNYIDRYIKENMIPEAEKQLTGDPRQPTLPLIRLRLEFTEEYQNFNSVRYSQTLTGLVANTEDVVLLKREGATRGKRKPEFQSILEGLEDARDDERIEDITERLFDEADNIKNSLLVLSARALSVAVRSFIDKDDKSAIDDIVYDRQRKVQKMLKEKGVSEEQVKEALVELRQLALSKKEEEEDETRQLLLSGTRGNREANIPVRGSAVPMGGHSDSDDDYGPQPTSSVLSSSSSRGARGGRGSRGGPGSRGGRGSRARGRAAAAQANTSVMNISRYTTSSKRADTSLFDSSPQKTKKAKFTFVADDSD